MPHKIGKPSAVFNRYTNIKAVVGPVCPRSTERVRSFVAAHPNAVRPTYVVDARRFAQAPQAFQHCPNGTPGNHFKARRPYQQEAITSVVNRISTGNRRHLIILPTGTGKTFIAEQMAKELIAQPQLAHGRILVIAPTAEIANQNALGFKAAFGGNVGVLHTGGKPEDAAYNGIQFTRGADPGTRVVSATIQSLMAMGDHFNWSQFSLVLADEAHHYVPGNEGYFEPFQRLGFFAADNNYLNPEGRVLIGFTATPDRLDNQPGSRLVDVYGMGGIAYTRDINDFTEGLGGVQYLRQPHRIAVPLTATDTAGRKLTGREAWRGMATEQKAEIIAHLFREHPDLSREGHPKRTILYVSDVAEAMQLQKELRGYGFKAFAVTGETSDRARKIQAFRDGSFDIMLGVNVPKEGFDVPGVEVVMLFGAATESRGQVVQMIGRASRIDPEHPERKKSFVVDPWNLGDKHDIQMRGETAYALTGVASGVGESAKPRHRTGRTPAAVTTFTWEGVNLGGLINPENNIFMSALIELFAGEDAITIAAYRAGMSSDTLRSWWLGQSLPQTVAEVERVQAALQITDERLTLAYQETTGMAVKSFLISRLRDRAIELGRVPMQQDMGGQYASRQTYEKYFDSWSQVIELIFKEALTKRRSILWTNLKTITALSTITNVAITEKATALTGQVPVAGNQFVLVGLTVGEKLKGDVRLMTTEQAEQEFGSKKNYFKVPLLLSAAGHWVIESAQAKGTVNNKVILALEAGGFVALTWIHLKTVSDISTITSAAITAKATTLTGQVPVAGSQFVLVGYVGGDKLQGNVRLMTPEQAEQEFGNHYFKVPLLLSAAGDWVIESALAKGKGADKVTLALEAGGEILRTHEDRQRAAATWVGLKTITDLSTITSVDITAKSSTLTGQVPVPGSQFVLVGCVGGEKLEGNVRLMTPELAEQEFGSNRNYFKVPLLLSAAGDWVIESAQAKGRGTQSKIIPVLQGNFRVV